MSKINSAFSIKGESGNIYVFKMYTIDTSFKSVGRICIFTERTLNEKKYTHKLICIQQINDLSQIKKSETEGSNCICVMNLVSNPDEVIKDIKDNNTFII